MRRHRACSVFVTRLPSTQDTLYATYPSVQLSPSLIAFRSSFMDNPGSPGSLARSCCFSVIGSRSECMYDQNTMANSALLLCPIPFFFLVEINLKKKISILLFWYKYGIRLYSMRCDALNDRTTRDLFARVGTQRHTRVHSRTSSTGARDSDADKELRTGIQKTCMRASMRDLSFSRSLSVTDGRGRLGLI